MSLAKRVIPRLDIKGPYLVKGIHLEGLRVLGNPEDFAKSYYEQGADELLYQDVVASLYNRNSLDDFISRTARSIFIPLTVGGGLRSVADITRVLRAGADKVALNTAAINNPAFISEAANIFGSSTISVSIEACRQPDGTYQAFTDNGREYTGKEVISWAKEVQSRGAGEIIVTSIDTEGTGEGFDCELSKHVAQAVSIPVVAVGGAGSTEDVLEVLSIEGISAVGIASVLHYHHVRTHATEVSSQRTEGNMEFLKSKQTFSKIQPHSLSEIKEYLQAHEVLVRR